MTLTRPAPVPAPSPLLTLPPLPSVEPGHRARLAIEIRTPSDDGRTPEAARSFLSTDTVDFVANSECVQWSVYDGSNTTPAQSGAGRVLRFRPAPPQVLYGRKGPLSYLVLATDDCETKSVLLEQDGIDMIRQQYVDRAKSDVPSRSAFISQDHVNGHHISYQELRSRDGATWAVFKIFGKFDRWRDAYGRKFTINRGYTTPLHNDAIHGAARNSQHIFGTAVDVQSSRSDWFAKRDAVRDAGACMEPVKISGWGHVHADWRDATACAASWKYPRAASFSEHVPPIRVPPRDRLLRMYLNGNSATGGRRNAGIVGVAGALLGTVVVHEMHLRLPRRPTPCPMCEKMLANDWPLDAVYLEELNTGTLSDADKLWLISHLELYADAVANRPWGTEAPLCEDFSSFFIDLTLAVADLNDTRAISVLTRVTDVAPTIATRLAELGDDAVTPLLSLLRDPALGDSTAYTLGRFLEGHRARYTVLSEANVRRIRRALMRLARRRGEAAVRGSAIVSLGELNPDRGLIKLLKRLARDPELLPFVQRVRTAWVGRGT